MEEVQGVRGRGNILGACFQLLCWPVNKNLPILGGDPTLGLHNHTELGSASPRDPAPSAQTWQQPKALRKEPGN